MSNQIIGRGAEAILIKKDNILVKDRIKKSYRNNELDLFLRSSRTRHESRLLEKALQVIQVPQVKKTRDFEIEMEFIQGKKLSDFLDNFPEKEALKICEEIGKSAAKIHDKNIIHGDLTTSNMLWQEKEKKVYFIDFGLGFISTRIEDKAVDLHLLKQALKSKHFKRWESYFKEVIEGYNSKDKEAILKQLEKVESRGRYKKK
jgi:Kae1-associated kinase Bud32